MANQPLPTTHDVVVQDSVTGAVDYLQFAGNQLAASNLVNYGIAGSKIVASGDFNGDGHADLVAQSTTTGQLDFLFLDANGKMTASVLTVQGFAPVHGAGDFGAKAAGQVGPTLVSQNSDGSIDLLAFDNNGHNVASFLVANTAGLPNIVGVGDESGVAGPAFGGLGSDSSIVVQYGNGTLDALGFSGSFSNGTLTFSASLLLPGTTGSSAQFVMDQDFSNGLNADANVSSNVDGTLKQTIEFTGLYNGFVSDLFLDSGYNDSTHTGTEIGMLQTNYALSTGYQIVDAGIVAHSDFFPIV